MHKGFGLAQPKHCCGYLKVSPEQAARISKRRNVDEGDR